MARNYRIPTRDPDPVEQTALSNLSRRYKCDDTCPYYLDCPMMMSSRQGDGQCQVRNFPITWQRTFINLFSRGAEGLKNEIVNQLYTIRTRTPSISTDPDTAKDYMKLLLSVFKEFHGKDANKNLPDKLVIHMQEPEKNDVVNAEYRFKEMDKKKESKNGKRK